MESVIQAREQMARSVTVSTGVDCTGVGEDPLSASVSILARSQISIAKFCLQSSVSTPWC